MYDLIVTTAFGLEAVVKRELEALGLKDIKASDRKIECRGTATDVVRCNLWLRCAERVYLRLARFPAETFDELFEGVKALPWAEWVTEEGRVVVDGRSHRSKLFSISDSQAITKKAIVEKLKQTYPVDWFEERGELYRVEVSLLDDEATITLDTSGAGLHKRGYRSRAGDAPIKETLAAAMLMLSFWNPSRVLYDPFCGSGTILIEAAMIGRNIAPGLDRDFDSAHWPWIGEELYKQERRAAMAAIDHDKKLHLLGSDTDKRSVLRARDNADAAGVGEDIQFFMKDMRIVDLRDDYGVVVTNPPYGERMGERREARELYRDFGAKMNALDTWSVYAIVGDEAFEKFYGKKADRKRKLYNGRIKTDYYQFYGPKPPRNGEGRKPSPMRGEPRNG